MSHIRDLFTTDLLYLCAQLSYQSGTRLLWGLLVIAIPSCCPLSARTSISGTYSPLTSHTSALLSELAEDPPCLPESIVGALSAARTMPLLSDR